MIIIITDVRPDYQTAVLLPNLCSDLSVLISLFFPTRQKTLSYFPPDLSDMVDLARWLAWQCHKEGREMESIVEWIFAKLNSDHGILIFDTEQLEDESAVKWSIIVRSIHAVLLGIEIGTKSAEEVSHNSLSCRIRLHICQCFLYELIPLLLASALYGL